MKKALLTIITILGLFSVLCSFAAEKSSKSDSAVEQQTEQQDPALAQAEKDIYSDEDAKLKDLESAPVDDKNEFDQD